MDQEELPPRELLRAHGLRATAPRLAVLRLLASAEQPLSYTQVLELLGQTDWDPATIYRNLVKLSEAGVATIASRAGGLTRYALTSSRDEGHCHPHFVCDDCGRVACLPADLTASLSIEGRWSTSVKQAVVHLRGECPDCLQRASP